jgi:multidrug transporter EmrE-like cation transporter
MKKIGIGAIGIFLLMQIFVQVTFKWGSLSEANWLPGFIVANVVSISSTWFMMVSYKHLNPNIAFGIAVSSMFICSQVALSLVFKSRMVPAQWVILVVIAVCMALFTFLEKKQENN